MSVRNLATLDRTVFQPLGRIIQEAFADGFISTGRMSITHTMTGASAYYPFHLTVIDQTTGAIGCRAIDVAFTSAGVKTGGGEVAAIGAGIAVTADTPHVYGYTCYLGSCGSATVGDISAFRCYIDDFGAAATVAEKHAIDLNMNATNAPTSVCSFMRMYNHGGTIDAAFYFANNGNAVVANLLKFNASGGCLEPDASSVSGNRTHKIKCLVGGSTFYLNGYAA